MLVKLLKNDYYNRGKTLLFCCLMLIVDAIVIHFFTGLDVSYDDSALFVFRTLVLALCYIVLYVSFPVLILGSVSDFGKRYFKSQGYFTHTLPVKTSLLLIARMVADVINTIIITITYIIMASIISEDLQFVQEMIDSFKRIPFTDDATAAQENMSLILTILIFLFGILFVLWQYNAAYALGHAYNNAKRIKSVGFFILIYIVEIILLSVFLEPITDALFDRDMDYVKSHFLQLEFFLVLEIIGIVCMGAITLRVCKKKLNLE